MPTYQYACTESACGHRFETVQSFSDDPLTRCPQCEGRLRKVFSAVGVVFKGSGFYRTDSRAAENGKAKSSAEANGSGDSKSPDGSGSGGSGASGAGGSSSSGTASSSSSASNGRSSTSASGSGASSTSKAAGS